jgi:hypothetical protein
LISDADQVCFLRKSRFLTEISADFRQIGQRRSEIAWIGFIEESFVAGKFRPSWQLTLPAVAVLQAVVLQSEIEEMKG